VRLHPGDCLAKFLLKKPFASRPEQTAKPRKK
jgi:hypothetical protein